MQDFHKDFTHEAMTKSAQNPENVGFKSGFLDLISLSIQEAVVQQTISGAVALLIKDGQTAYFQGFGYRNIESNDLIQEDDIFVLASMTKPITSTAVMMLYEQGFFDLETPITDFIPEFEQSKVLSEYNESAQYFTLNSLKSPITIRQLLSHTAGLGYPFLDNRLNRLSNQSSGLDYGKDLKANLPFFAHLPLLHQPGQGWQYGYSVDVLGRLIEVVSGKTLDVFFQENIFAPLGMTDTFFALPPNKFDRFTTRYQSSVGGKLIPLSRTRPPKPVFLSGGGGLLSTAVDYARFLQMFLNKGKWNHHQILQPKTIEMMTHNQIGALYATEKRFPIMSGKDKFGLGFMIHSEEAHQHTPLSSGSYSWFGIYNTWFWVDPHYDLIGILLTQVTPFCSAESMNLYKTFQTFAYEGLRSS
jgi:CubicO group peptidase (beta-lactamase class C family)